MSYAPETVVGLAAKIASKGVLAGALATSVAQTMVVSAEGLGVESIFQSLLQIGGPTALGMLAANTVTSYTGSDAQLKYDKLIKRGVISGGVAVGVLMLAGGLPVGFDVQTAGLIGVVALGSMVGDYVAHDWATLSGT